MKRDKTCETECSLVKFVGQACHSKCGKLEFKATLYKKGPLAQHLDAKGKK